MFDTVVKFDIVYQKVLRIIPERIRKALTLRMRIHLAGQVLVVPIGGDESLFYLNWTRSWKSELFERLSSPERGAFIDVGANIGQTLIDLLFAQPNTLYFGFEPNLASFYYLSDLITANSLQGHIIVPIGLAEKSKIVPLYTYENSVTDQDATMIADLRAGLQKPSCLVSCFSLDAIRDDLGIGRIGFVKIDVEGLELDVIIGMRESLELWRPVVLCEVLFSFPTPSHLESIKARTYQLMEILREMGYHVHQIQKSADHSCINAVVKIEDFSAAYWTEKNRHLCDYLFIPIEDEMRVLHALAIST